MNNICCGNCYWCEENESHDKYCKAFEPLSVQVLQPDTAGCKNFIFRSIIPEGSDANEVRALLSEVKEGE